MAPIDHQNLIAMFIHRFSVLLSCFVGFLLTAHPLLARQSTPPSTPLPRLGSEVVLDGSPFEVAWEAIPTLPTVVYEPVFGADPSVRTEIRVAYDDTYIYAAAWLWDDKPDQIRAVSQVRDEWESDDAFALVLDTFNDRENAMWFATTPAGIRADIAVSGDGSESGLNRSWNTYWDVETTRNEEGWFVEMRIPFSSLRFQIEDGQVRMGLIAYRYIARKNERHIHPAIPPNWSLGFVKPSQAARVDLTGLEREMPVYITPYVATGGGWVPEAPKLGRVHGLDRTTQRDIGLDVKVGLTENLALDLTANTDFAQVEADNQQVNLTRFSLFFPEKRAFFQERAGIFSFGLQGFDRLFHSRTIGLKDGQSVPILGGARMVGRLADWDVGVVSMQTGKQGSIYGENFGVLRARRQVLNDLSTAGGMFTSRLGPNGTANLALGLDSRLNITGDEFLTVRLAGTYDQGSPVSTEAIRGFLSWDRVRNEGLSYTLEMVRSGRSFNPGMGFVSRNDFTKLRNMIKTDIFTDEHRWLRRVQPGLWTSAYFRNGDGSLESLRSQGFLTVETKSGAFFWLGPTVRYEDIRVSFPLSGMQIQPDTYLFGDFWVGGIPGSTKRMTLPFDLRTGPFYDGWWHFASVRPTWALRTGVDLQAEYELNALRFGELGRVNAHIARLRLQLAPSRRFSSNTFLQYSSAAKRITVNARFRFHFQEGQDLWLVFNEGRLTDTSPSSPDQFALHPVTDRTVLLKYTHTFQMSR